ncbi:class I SAM-dependent methyltransferase [Bacillus sp. FJAT-27245]|uniref:class I SAM-dependent methyltransferase n=1 Tax=Bacillus sp. FJAT-27245 TaxID=1684144 RepID=UPI0006A7D608|nr:methyltransferase domain-containing protein [Bacillus sp. FJAT-27245]
MQHPDRNHVREKWNKKHNERLAEMGDPLPNERLKYLSQSLAGGKALDLACGLGGNCLFLAGHGYAVDAADISETAIKHVRELAEKRVLKLNASVMDLTDAENLPFKKGAYDLVVIAYYLDRALFPYVKCLLKEGGLFFLETYCDSPKLAGGKVSDKFRLKPNELLDEFRGWKVLFFEENELEGRQTIFCRKPGLQ